MSPEVLAFVASQIGTPDTVLEYGSVYINGTARDAARDANWHGIDIVAGQDVDEVADASTYIAAAAVDVVVCCEVFEHTTLTPEICATAYKNIKPGGRFITTCASDGRAPHSAFDGGQLRPGEHYRNIPEAELVTLLEDSGFTVETVQFHADRGDLYVMAVKNNG